MENRTYKYYLDIDRDLPSVMTMEALRRHADDWLKFYPHEGFIKLLRTVINSFSDDKPVWLWGAYGTGKSFAALVLQKLFMDSDDLVECYFAKRREQIPAEIVTAIKRLRADGTLTCFCSGSDYINSPTEFLVRIEKCILRSLQAFGYTIPPMGQLDSIIERIKEEGERFFRTRDSIQGELSYLIPSISSVERLQQELLKPAMQNGLINDIMKVLEKRAIYLNLSTENLIKWIEEVLRINKKERLVFIWDEFSNYIETSKGRLDTFQDLAQASIRRKFYFMPVTHMSLESFLGANTQNAKKVLGRFTTVSLDMPTNIAMKLAADVFKYVPEHKEEWTELRDNLWHSVEKVVRNYMSRKDEDCNREPECFRALMPIHPMAAYMLKTLATTVDSNQRSMFNFLKDAGDHSEFQQFIAQNGVGMIGRQYLTVDNLWQFFIERDDLGVSRDISDVRGEFINRSRGLDEQECRVLKAMLLYSLVSQVSGGRAANELLQPTVENITRCFEADGQITNVEEYLRELERKHCFSIVNGMCQRFRASGNSQDLEKKKLQYKSQFNSQILNDKTLSKIESQIKRFKDKLHYDVRVADTEKVRSICNTNRELYSKEGKRANKLLLQFIIANDADEQLRIPDVAKQLAREYKDFRMLFITLPEVYFCSVKKDIWDEYTEQLANLDLATDQAMRTNYSHQISLMDEEWFKRINDENMQLEIYEPNSEGEPYHVNRQWNTLQAYLKEYLKQCFPNFVDDLSDYNNTAMTLAGGGMEGYAKAGMDFGAAKGAIKNITTSFAKKGIVDNAEWFAQNATHPLTKLRDFCKNKLDNALNGSTGTCSIRKIYIDLQRAPFGLLCVPFTAFVLGFVMRDWADNPQRPLQWTNGAMTEPLSRDILAEMIAAVVKDDGYNNIRNEKLICRISQEERRFIEVAPRIFGIERVAGASVEMTLQKIAERLDRIANKSPLWVLPSYIQSQNEPYADECRAVIEALCVAQGISSHSEQQLQEKTNKIKCIGQYLKDNDELVNTLANYIDTAKFDAAFRQYVDTQRSSLAVLATRVGDNSGKYCKVLKDHFAQAASWLWTRNNVDDEFVRVEAQYRIIAVIQKLSGVDGYMDYEDAIQLLKHAIYDDNKISLEIFNTSYPFIARFCELLDNGGLGNSLCELAEACENHETELKKLFFEATHAMQLATLRKLFDTLLASVSDNELVSLYDNELSGGARMTMPIFKSNASKEITAYIEKSVVKQLMQVWKQKSGSDTPREWSAKYNMPVVFLFKEQNDAAEIILVLSEPKNYQGERIRQTKERLEEAKICSEPEMMAAFSRAIIPPQYASLQIDVSQLAEYLRDNFDRNPNNWLAQSTRVSQAVHAYILRFYENTYKQRAIVTVNNMSSDEAKHYLLNLVADNPEVGIGLFK